MGRRAKKPRTVQVVQQARQTGKTLAAALAPFANVDIPSGKDGECIWFYVGRPQAGNPCHLTLEDFQRARRALR